MPFKKSLLPLTFLFFISCRALALDVFVSPQGNDANSGTLAHPLATLHKAQLLARQHKNQIVTVWLRSGVYYLARPVTFSADDSRLANAPLIFKAYRAEHPTISGAARLTLTWTPYRNGIMQAKVPTLYNNAAPVFDELFVNGQLQRMARYPNFDTEAKHYNGTAEDVLSPARIASWESPAGGYIHALHKSEWGDMAYRITGKNAQGDLTMEGGWQNNRPSAIHAKYRFVEHIFEELDAPNEWYFDAATSMLYYYPPVGINLKTAVVETAQISELFAFQGNEKQPVRGITIEGLELTQTTRTFMQNREPLLRSDWTIYRHGAVTLQGTENCAIRNCYFNNVGGNAVVFSNYNRRGGVSGCRIINAGSSGVVFVGDPAAVRSPLFQYSQANDLTKMDLEPVPKSNNYPAQCRVYNNLIEGIGRIEKQVAGVQLSMCAEITVSHNTIDNVPRAGINVNEGTWGGHIIEFNDVFDTVQETGDHGAFNSWGRDRFWFPVRKQMDSINLARPELAMLDVVKPIIIRNNRFRCDHGWDIDLDDGSSNYQIYNNLCLNGGLKLREGFNRSVWNNVIINNSFHPHVWFKNSHSSFRHNIVSAGYFPISLKFWGNEIDENFFPDSAALAKSQANKVDAHSLYSDPGFIDPAKGDFRIKANSAAFKTGFKNFPMNQFGVVSPALKAQARKVRIPAIAAVLNTGGQESIEFLGTRVKSLNTLGERSATGMAEETGVLVLEVPKKSVLYGFIQPNDVLLALGDKRLQNIKELSAASMGLQTTKEVTFEIFRNQVVQRIIVRLK